MSEKPEALRLAQELEAYHTRSCHKEAAAELRRQHAEIERLKAELTYDWDQLKACRASLREHMAEIKRLKAERDEAVKAEREACAKMCDQEVGELAYGSDDWYTAKTLAAIIRAREDKT